MDGAITYETVSEWKTPYDLVRCRICGVPFWARHTPDKPLVWPYNIASAWPLHTAKCEGHRHMPKYPPSLKSNAVVAKNFGVQSARAENLIRYPADVMPVKATERRSG
jgi:hypothetical protein